MDIAVSQQESEAEIHWQRFSVPYEYPVYFTDNLFDPENPILREAVSRLEPRQRHRCLVFVDDGPARAHPALIDDIRRYAAHHGDLIELVADPVRVPGGEAIKSDPTAIERLQRIVFDHRIDRHSYVIAIGGGAVLDAVGLVAATAHRGIRHIRVPTTVLSQDDSGVGVKNGINLFGAKNYLGTFAPPFAVLNDMAFVMALDARERVAGMAEAVKVSLIRDGAFFAWLEHHAEELAAFDRHAMAYLIRRCAGLHMHQIAHGGDPFETGSARPLDYGHWSAHKIEGMTGYAVRHGEAVAMGIVLDARYSVLRGLLREGEEERVRGLLKRLGFTLWHPAYEARDGDGRLTVLAGLRDFREHLGGELTITLLSAVGRGVEVHEMDEGLVADAIAWMKSRRGT